MNCNSYINPESETNKNNTESNDNILCVCFTLAIFIIAGILTWYAIKYH